MSRGRSARAWRSSTSSKFHHYIFLICFSSNISSQAHLGGSSPHLARCALAWSAPGELCRESPVDRLTLDKVHCDVFVRSLVIFVAVLPASSPPVVLHSVVDPRGHR
jgi:hypothetical protein